MKKSNKVMLTAVFLSAISGGNSHAQTVPDTLGSPKPGSDSAISFNDTSAYAKDSSGYYRQQPPPPQVYVYPENYGFWWRFRMFFRVGHYGRRWHEHHDRPATAVTHQGSGPGYGPRTAPQVQHSTSTAAMPRKQGFGTTMSKKPTASAST